MKNIEQELINSVRHDVNSGIRRGLKKSKIDLTSLYEQEGLLSAEFIDEIDKYLRLVSILKSCNESFKNIQSNLEEDRDKNGLTGDEKITEALLSQYLETSNKLNLHKGDWIALQNINISDIDQSYSNQELLEHLESLTGILSGFKATLATSLYRNNNVMQCWLKVEKYIKTKDVITLNEVTQILKAIHEKSSVSTGIELLPGNIKYLVQKAYTHGNSELVDAFKANLPFPNSSIFPEDQVPEIVLTREAEANEVLFNLITKTINITGNNFYDVFKKIEKIVIKMQRFERKKIREKQEVERLQKIFVDDNLTKEQAIAALKDANTPYRPKKCSNELAERIIEASKGVKLFDQISHACSAKNLVNIIECIYGRQTLLKHYIPFRKAALEDADRENGDANIICFGPNEIDGLCFKGNSVKITLDLEKLSSNPCILYKQRDFGFAHSKIRTIDLLEKQISFSHTEPKGFRPGFYQMKGHYHMKLHYHMWLENKFYSQLPSYSLIAYDVKKMHEILSLNFFRFLDNLHCKALGSQHCKDGGSQEEADSEIQSIYDAIEAFSDREMVAFLEDLGKNMTDTMEFNFFGAYKIDLEAIETIQLFQEKTAGYILSIQDLISDLSSGNICMLNHAKEHIPTLFQSFRFVHHLMDNVQHDEMREKLQTILDTSCQIPKYLSTFYGGHDNQFVQGSIGQYDSTDEIDLESIATIELFQGKTAVYILSIQDLISDLRSGNIGILNDAKEHIPTLFQNFRFVHHLMDNVQHDEMREKLQTILATSCQIPEYLSIFYRGHDNQFVQGSIGQCDSQYDSQYDSTDV